MADKTPEPEKEKKKPTIKKAFKSGEGEKGALGLPVLFTQEEMDIFVNKITMEAYIFHSKPVPQDIERLEYNPEDHSVIVVKKDKTLMDLGVKIQWMVRPYFTKAKEIGIVQTRDGEALDGFYVPLVWKQTEGKK